ncbi:MAG TPA: hypothetical protein VHG72_13955 [Polyangia bacterium]|nr:hypothetical protein [Polyangia bacterium]
MLNKKSCARNTAALIRGVEIVATCSCGEIWDDIDRVGYVDTVVDVAMANAKSESLGMVIDHWNEGHTISVSERFRRPIAQYAGVAIQDKGWRRSRPRMRFTVEDLQRALGVTLTEEELHAPATMILRCAE